MKMTNDENNLIEASAKSREWTIAGVSYNRQRDIGIIDGITRLARDQRRSFSNYVLVLFAEHLKEQGIDPKANGGKKAKAKQGLAA